MLYTIVSGDGGGVKTRSDPHEVTVDVRRGTVEGKEMVLRLTVEDTPAGVRVKLERDERIEEVEE